jgi:DNA-directed RNA polymerase specialized sigma24 family protein
VLPVLEIFLECPSCRETYALRGFARWLTGNREAGDALARDTLVRAWQARATYVPGTNLKSWLFCIFRKQFRSTYCRTQ